MGWFLRYEGGPVGVAGDRKAAADWYCRHMDMTVAFDSPAEGQTLVKFPAKNAIPLVSMTGPLWWGGPDGISRESAVRMCFACPDLRGTHAALAAEGVRVSEIRPGPGPRDFFDFYDLEGTRLTAASHPELAADAPGARFAGYSNLRIGVRDWRAARDWYARYMGTTVLDEHPAEGAVLMGLGDFLPIWLETQAADAFGGNVSPAVRPEFLALDIEGAHRYSAEAGLSPSPLEGEPGGHRAFHLFDPDGNRINVHTYPGAQAKLKEYQG